MAITINGVTYRNLQEQVEKNQEDIEVLQSTLTGTTITPNVETTSSTALYNLKLNDTTYKVSNPSLHMLEIGSSTFNRDMFDLLSVYGIGSFVYEEEDDQFTTSYSAVAEAFYDQDNDSYSATVYYAAISSNGIQWTEATSGTLYYYK